MLREIKPTKVFERVIEQIKEIIQNGELRRGDRLPSERDLCKQLNTSRASIREALRSLETLGIIECRQGEGNFIKEFLEGSPPEPTSMTLMLHRSKTNGVPELRKIIEPETVVLAAKNISDTEFQEIKELMSLLNHEDDSTKSAKIGKKIHYKIVQALGNDLITSVMYVVSNLIDRYVEDVVNNLFQSPENGSIVKGQHEAVVRVIEAHDVLKITAVMRKHLDYINDLTGSSIIREQGD